MLATVAQASDSWAGVWIGATAGMVLADGVAIAVGALLHKRLPEGFLRGMASVLFLLFGLWLLFDGALGLWVALGVTAAAALATATAAVVVYIRSRREHPLQLSPLNRRRIRASPRLATVGQTTDQLPTVGSLSGVTCRGAHRRHRAPIARVDN
jgi:Ca2+/H+ antiporter, TMEM165/GDT1 family